MKRFHIKRRLLRFASAAAFGLVAVGLTPALAGATTCSFMENPSPSDDVMTVMPSPGETVLRLQRSNNGLFAFNQLTGGTSAICAPTADANVNNVTKIVIDDLPGNNLTVLVTEQGGTFTPGVDGPPEAGGPEIEIEFTAGDGTDELQYDGTDNADRWRFGQTAPGTLAGGTNLAVEGTAAPDVDDIKAAGLERALLNGRQGDDVIDTTGGIGPDAANPLFLTFLQVEGGNHNDELIGGPEVSRMLGGTQDDTLRAGAGNDELDGGDHNDTLDPGDGADNIDGNTGIDFLTYATRNNGVIVTIDDVPGDGGPEDNFGDNVRTTVENVKGGNGADQISGSFFNNELTGSLGNDTINGFAGIDKVSGSGGDDRVLGSSGNDRLFLGSGKDNGIGGSGNDMVNGGSGKDIMRGNKGNDRLKARDGQRDRKINCGKGPARLESFTRDSKDPKAKSC